MDTGHDASASAPDAAPTPGDDLSAIAWVQEELRRTLEAAHKALRRFLKDAEAVTGSDLDAVDPGVLRNARTQIHQGAGALELVGLPAAATVLRASETAVQRAIAKASWLTPELVGDIERSSFALLDYLQRLLAGKNVSPLALFPQYRAVQEAVEAERVHPADLWTNEWRWREIAPVPGTLPRQADATTRGDLEGQLLQLMRGSQALTAAGRMAEVCAGLAAGTDHPQVRTFWSLAAGFFEGQHHGLLPFDVFTKRVASRLLAQFRLLQKGDSDVSERLARDVLFFCSQAAPAGRGVRAPHLQAVRAAYGLVEQPPVDYSASVLGRFDPAIVAHARKRVDTATGTWHAIAGGESHRIAALGEQFALVGDSLRKLFPHGESFAAELQTAAQLTLQANAAPPPALAMEVATSLLYIAAALEDADFDHPEHATRVRRLAERLASVRQGAPQPPLETWMEELYRRVSDRQTMGSVVQELRASLAEVEKAIDTFFRSPDDRAVLVDVPVKLGAMRGVLSVLGMDAAVQAVARMRDEVDQLAAAEAEADPLRRRASFDRLAGNLSALGFLIDMLSVQPQLAKSLFRYDPETGTLAPVMGRSERRAEPEVAPVAPRLVEQAQLLAFASVRDDVPLDAVQRDLERLSHEAQAADQPQLAAAVLKAQEAIVQARGDDHAITTARGELSEALVDFVATSTEPAGLDILGEPAATGSAAAPIAPIAVVSDLEHDDEMREVFLEEAREVVASARDATAQLHQQPDDVALVTTVRRAFHTLKGSSRMVGLKSFGEAAWACEQIYNTQLAEPQPASPALLAFTERTLDELEAWIDDVAAKRDGSRSEGDIKLAADRLTRRLKQGDAGADLELPIEPTVAAAEAGQAGPTSAFGALPTLPPDLPSAADLDLVARTPVAATEAAEEVSFELDLAGLDAGAAGPETVPATALDAGDGELPEAGTALELPPDSPLLEPFEPGATGDEPRADFADSTLEGIDLDLGSSVDAPLIEPLEPTHEHGHDPAGPATMPGLLDHAPQLPSAHWRNDSAPLEHIELDFGEAAPAPVPLPESMPEPMAEAGTVDALPEAAGEPAGNASASPAMAADATAAADTAPDPAEPAIAAVAAPLAEPAAEAMAADDAVDDNVKVVGPLRIGIPLFNIYLNEADELSRRLSTEVAEWSLEMHRPIGETAIALAHSLAGSSATVGFADLSQLARALEHAMARSHDIGHGTDEEARLFVDASDDIRRLLHQFAAGFLKEPTPGLFARLSEHEATSARRLEAATAASELELDADDDVQATPAAPDSEPITLDFGTADEAATADATGIAEVAAADAGAHAHVDADADADPDAEAEADAAARADATPPPSVHPLAEPIGEPALVAAPTDDANAGTAPAAADEPAMSSFGALAPAAGLGLAELKPLEARDGEAAKPVVARSTAYGEFDDDIDAVDAVDLELFPIFEEEAQDLLPKLDAQLRDWAREPAAASAATACMRTLHTLKGGARLAGAMRLGEMAHRLETRIERLTQGDAQPTTADIEGLQMRADAMAHAFDALSRKDAQAYADAVAAAVAPVVSPVAAPAAAEPAPAPAEAPPPVAAAPATSQPPPADAVPAAEAASDTPADATPTPTRGKPRKGGRPTLVPPAPAPAEAAAPVAIDWSRFLGRAGTQPVARPAEHASAASQSSVRVRAPLLDRLVNQAGEVSITRSRIESGVGQIRNSLADLTENLERLRGQLRDLELQGEVQMTSRLEAAKALSQAFDPLEFDRFTRFQELTRMMAESVNDVATVQRSLQRSIESAEDELVAQARLTRDLQDDLLRTRMVEFEGLSDRLYRVVRLAAKETGKQVRLDIVGGSIEVDRGVLDRMTGAFEHLLRNCVSHGIEAPDARVQAGKDATGTIVVALTQEGNEVGVEFRDDGAGLDLARIRDKAVSSGLIARDARVDDAELANLIFAPGFTTVEKVTELAGRGIGMDVVRSEVVAMGGRIETATSAGQGTSFRLILPLTTAVTQVVMIRAAESTIAVPSTLVEIVRRAPADAVAAAYATGVYEEGGQSLPFYWLGALLQQPGQAAESTAKTRPVVIVRSAQQRIAVHVDDVLGNQEVVVKNLGPQLSRLPGLAGMTLLASGTVALIYNPVALATLYGEDARQSMRARMAPDRAPGAAIPLAPQPADRLEPPQAPLILVVDDSLTVRRVTQRLLVREGYRVTLAKDGLDAIEKLAEEVPQVVLSDIEMPRMDGFDLVRNLRADPRWRDLPVIMITSRIAEKHREHARELGVDHYLGKPYSEEELLSLIAAETLRVSASA